MYTFNRIAIGFCVLHMLKIFSRGLEPYRLSGMLLEFVVAGAVKTSASDSITAPPIIMANHTTPDGMGPLTAALLLTVCLYSALRLHAFRLDVLHFVLW